MGTVAEITKKALSLSIEDRVVLAQRVWESLEHFANADIEQAWMEEADRRWREIEEGTVQCQPADRVMRRARESLKR